MQLKKSKLILENGLEFQGYSFGYPNSAHGEVVFNTAMVGYPESLTDPSYSGQILCVTYPIIGNYGVPADSTDENGISNFYESDKIHARALIISDYSFNYSHWDAVKSLDEWLKEEKVPGLFGIDTRELTKVLREHGAMLGKIVPEGMDENFEVPDPNKDNQVDIVSCKEVITYGKKGKKRVVLVDCGVKNNILRCLIRRNIELVRVPWNYDFNKIDYDGLFISNGPGNPDLCDIAVDHLLTAMQKERPIFGICMGNQLLSKAAGGTIFKLKYGHRSHNQPVRMVGTERCFITSQNHGFAVDDSSIGKDWEPLFLNMNDGTNEGIKHKTKPFFSAQFHPEASSGPTDTEFLFDEFIKML
jgi:carbamoyl-phosphate synthase small subunit